MNDNSDDYLLACRFPFWELLLLVGDKMSPTKSSFCIKTICLTRAKMTAKRFELDIYAQTSLIK